MCVTAEWFIRQYAPASGYGALQSPPPMQQPQGQVADYSSYLNAPQGTDLTPDQCSQLGVPQVTCSRFRLTVWGARAQMQYAYAPAPYYTGTSGPVSARPMRPMVYQGGYGSARPMAYQSEGSPMPYSAY